MTATADPSVKEREVLPLELVESTSIDSSTDLIPSEFNESKYRTEEEDFVNSFICHLIFYSIFCVTLVLYLLLDLGLASFIKNKFKSLNGLGKETVPPQTHAFA